MKRSQIRESVFILLYASMFHDRDQMKEQTERFLDGLEEDRFDEIIQARPAEKDQKLIEERVAAVLEHVEEIDALLNAQSEGWPTSRMSRADLSLLRLAVYEMKYDDQVPLGVAINEAVEIAKKYGGDNTSSFVNGVLGKIAREMPS